MEQQDSTEKRIYEVGYLLVPTLAEESVAEELTNLKDLISKHGGSETTSGNPEMRQLAYTMRKEIDRKVHIFDKAYFGWIKFELVGDGINEIKKALDESDKIIRHLLVKAKKVKPGSMKSSKKITRKPKSEESTESKASESEIDEELDAVLGDSDETNSLETDKKEE